MDDVAFTERLTHWLADTCRVAEPRRIVRRDSSRIVVSKFEEGFAARLHEALARVPELADPVAIGAAFAALAAESPGVSRVATWSSAVSGLVERLAHDRDLDRDQLAEIRAGTDSVAALLDSVLWSSPLNDKPWTPSQSELDAHTEALARMDAQPGIFVRHYGTFEGASVENHCPGAQLARTLFNNAWAVCTELTG